MTLHEALFYEKLEGNIAACHLCPQECKIHDGKVGFCTIRKNIAGKLYTLVYDQSCAIALDPVEKKPLYHYHPGEHILSVGTKGCNLKCLFCQNWQIAQDINCPTEPVTSEFVIKKAKELKSFGIAYTYNEPFIWYEFVYDTAKLAKKEGLENVLVTNGYVNQDPLKQILPLIGAMNIDLKAMDNEFYKKICSGTLDPVLETIKTSVKACHVELTNLIIPTLNDTDELFRKLVDWVYDNCGPDVPLHFSRYFTCFKMDKPPTPEETLERAYNIAKKKLKYVYLGNI